MQVVYARQPFPESFTRALFLAGPTPRRSSVPSWRPRAVAILRELGFEGAVFVPEDGDGSRRFDYLDQVGWEREGLHMADCVAFWIPRDLSTLPGFTTNIEWGAWCDSGKAVLGAPEETPKLRYLEADADRLGVPRSDTLRGTLEAALAWMGPGEARSGGEREVPLFIWRQPDFQRWYQAQQAAGHRLDGARLEWHHRGGPRRDLFCWALKVRVYIPSEQRHKGGEVIITRPDIASVVAYRPAARLEDTRVVLVREFRSNAVTEDGFVHELPGGSAPEPSESARVLAAEELEQETGVALPPARFREVETRQVMATFLTHRAALFAVALTEEEITRFEAHDGQRFGEHDSERTWVEVRRLGEILRARDVDWTHVGMILRAIATPHHDVP